MANFNYLTFLQTGHTYIFEDINGVKFVHGYIKNVHVEDGYIVKYIVDADSLFPHLEWHEEIIYGNFVPAEPICNLRKEIKLR